MHVSGNYMVKMIIPIYSDYRYDNNSDDDSCNDNKLTF